MGIKQIVKKLKYYDGVLPKTALKEAIKKKEEMIPELLSMLEYTKENMLAIVEEKDEFYGYIYAYFLLASFKEKRAFPYLIDLINREESVVDYILGDDYPGYLPRLIASTYDGNDASLFSVIENKDRDEFVRSSVLATFGILYINGVKTKDFLVTYLEKLIKEREDDDCSNLHNEIYSLIYDLKLDELKDEVKKIYDCFTEDEISDLEERFQDDEFEINYDYYPIDPHYKYLDNVIEIMEDWDCFLKDEETAFIDSDEFNDYLLGNVYKYSMKKKDNLSIENDFDDDIHGVDYFVTKATWYENQNNNRKALDCYKNAFNMVESVCSKNNIKSIDEYDEKFSGIVILSNWLQDYELLLYNTDGNWALYERLDLLKKIQDTFDLERDEYYKEFVIRSRANALFWLDKVDKATEIIEGYLKENSKWIWGYVEMADWYSFSKDKEHYYLEKAKNILLRAIDADIKEDMDAVYERLIDICKDLGEEDLALEYEEKLEDYYS